MMRSAYIPETSPVSPTNSASTEQDISKLQYLLDEKMETEEKLEERIQCLSDEIGMTSEI